MNNNINIIEFEKDILANIDKFLQYKSVEKYFEDKNRIIEIKDLKDASNIIDNLFSNGNNYNCCVYGILIKNKEIGSKWELKYIGVRQSDKLQQRLKQHFVKKSKQTNSQLDKIKELQDKAIFGLKLANIADTKLRNYYEEKLIKDFAPDWNSHGKKR
ncbi:MAG: hypothetical protein VB048_07455 [Bacteroidaceae bacterium]|nr:hypothetical protein [Bacteroidaceae bacterium]